MLNFDLQMRFLHSATDACLQFGHATAAAAEAWQEQFQDGTTAQRPAPKPQSLFDLWAETYHWWLSQYAALWSQSGFFPAAPSPAAASLPWAAAFGWQPPRQPAFFAAPGSADFATAFWSWPWRMMPWTCYQSPLIVAMMSSGMPYSVASPAAKASTSAMDAAEALQEQWQLIIEAFRTDGDRGSPRMSSTTSY